MWTIECFTPKTGNKETLLLNIYWRKLNLLYKSSWALIFMILFVMLPNCNQPRYPSMSKWGEKRKKNTCKWKEPDIKR